MKKQIKNKKSNSIVMGLMDYLSETGDEQLLPEVAHNLLNIVREAKRAKEVLITSAVPLTNSQRENLRVSLGKLLHLDLPFRNNVDKNLLAGFTVKVADWYLDASLAYQLNKLRKSLLS